MIRRRTVLVLGAGASWPYGFPLGRDLLKGIQAALVRVRPGHDEPQNSELRVTLRLMRFEEKLVEDFAREIAATHAESIDLFLVRHPKLLRIGKAAIAALLAPLEKDAAFDRADADEDWYRYVFSKIVGHSVDDFGKNQLSIVTFNFDRSFERALFLYLRRELGLNDSAAANACSGVQVVHIHGELGAPKWLCPSAPNARDYGPRLISLDPYDREKSLDPVDLMTCVDSIKLYDEPCADAALEDAHELLRRAEAVCFLGFSFQEDNVAKLAADDWRWWPNEGAHRQATALGLEDGEISGARLLFPSQGLEFLNRNCKSFFRSTTFIHDPWRK